MGDGDQVGATQKGVRAEQGLKRVRAYLGGRLVVDTLTPWLVWESPRYPTYYVPLRDVRAELVETGQTEDSPSRGKGMLFDVRVDGAVAPAAGCVYAGSPFAELRELVRLGWDAMDEWMEEDEPIYTHVRDPYKRIDILSASRRVQVRVGGVEVADSSQPRILFETGLPPRYYLPLPHVRMDLLRPSGTVTHCPYKGDAEYWSVEVDGNLHADLVWTYRSPLLECVKIAGLACFYDERVDMLIDGVPHARPETHFS